MRVFIAFYDGSVKTEKEWIAITDGKFAEYSPDWSPDGRLLYFFSNRDGFMCLWAQRPEARSKHPIGAPFPVQHFHSARQSFGSIPLLERAISVTRDSLILSTADAASNIWMAEYKPR